MTSLSVDTADMRKARGAFFTPTAVAQFLTDWAIRTPNDRILEPSCGDAEFLTQAALRLDSLGVGRGAANQLVGVELHADSAKAGQQRVRAAGGEASIHVGDFFDWEPDATFDAVVGNPPYIRYQDFAGESRNAGRRAALRAGVRLTALASSWAAFVAYSSLFLKPGGRLALVIPAELLSVNYAAPVRQLLLDQFAELELVMFEERVFPGVLEEVLLVMADGYRSGSAKHATITQVRSAGDLGEATTGHKWTPLNATGKWTTSMLPVHSRDAYAVVTSAETFTALSTWGETTLGAVTGNNAFFCLSPNRARELDIPAHELLPLSPPGSRHLRQLALTPGQLDKLGQAGEATWLFRPSAHPSPQSQAYIETGHRAGVDLAYKCRVRRPWWRVPVSRPADLFLTYMNADTPRITSNTAGALHLNSVHGVYLKPEHRNLGRRLLPLASLNSATLLSAELVGRSYGGGMLKIEPREADSLLVPSPESVSRTAVELTGVRARVLRRLQAGDLLGAVELVDRAFIAADITSAELTGELSTARATLYRRRVSRGAEPSRRAHD